MTMLHLGRQPRARAAMIRGLGLLATAALSLLLTAIPAAAQRQLAGIQGTITDESKAVLPGVTEIPEFQKLLKYVCARGFEHHVAATRATVAEAIHDALDTYLRWDVYHHQ